MTNSTSPINRQERRFQKLAFLTILTVYLLILAGGIVRSTGSGMGCPDWPTCFGRWVPPTEISQLPTDYREIYGSKLKGEIEFNAVKTWIEYVNRLLGVLSGFFVFGTLLASTTYLRKDRTVFWGSFTAFVLIGLNGWLGSKVVATELAQYMITLHMLLAIAVVFALIFALVRSRGSRLQSGIEVEKTATLRWLLVFIMVITIIQIVLGTQVRSTLDDVVKRLGYEQRNNWIANLQGSFYVHRSFSLIILAFHGVVIYQLRKLRNSEWLTGLANGLIAIVAIEIGVGVIMAYLAVPAITQPIHLLLAILLIGGQFAGWLVLNPALIVPRTTSTKSRLVEI
ncbi:COX15/CtaA family protein [Spirosoma sp. BT702]|uniref:COX15/CtaA family protein n=1 Tax=Spirosoma profusum TaxID=2771354 RepID=A0A926XUE3_9BACT|nr:COX15/CtaA family protein [Spirosoma profusum]MBD2699676.1 COX15/CtaA family protein [Spirosoma profusum]